MTTPTVPRGRPPDPRVTAAVLDPANANLSTAELARQTGLPEATLRLARARGGLSSPAARGGHRGERVVRVRVTAEQHAEIEAYADRYSMELEDVILDNMLGGCDRCGEPAVLDALDVPLCVACRESKG